MGQEAAVERGIYLMECPECKADVDEELLTVIRYGNAVQVVCDGCGGVFIHELKSENWRSKYPRGDNQ